MPSIVNTFKDTDNPLIWVFDFTQGIVASDIQYFTPAIPELFDGYASLQVLLSSGQLTIQLQSSNTLGTDNFMIGYDTLGTAHPALCTALTTSKLFENIVIPPTRQNRWKITESSGTAPVTGTIYLYLKRTI